MTIADIDLERRIMERMAQLTRGDIMHLVYGLRMSWGFTQQEAAVFLQDVAVFTWQRWEAGKSRPQKHRLHMLIWLDLLTQQGHPLLLLEIERVKNIRREKKERAEKNSAELQQLRFDLFLQMKRNAKNGFFVSQESVLVH